jgi:hypothetical protein
MHRVKTKGAESQIQKLIDNHFCEYDVGPDFKEKGLNFETIIPSPEIVRKTVSGSSSNLGASLLRILSGENLYDKKYDQKISRQEGEKPRAAIRRFFRENPEFKKFGRLQLQCLEETGFPDWYGWNVQHWGTKWNAIDGKIVSISTAEGISELEFILSTAWSAAEPIWYKLGQLFPELSFRFIFFDEGWCFAGEGTLNDPDEKDGFVYYSPDSREKRWLDFQRDVYGLSEMEEDEELNASGGE